MLHELPSMHVRPQTGANRQNCLSLSCLERDTNNAHLSGIDVDVDVDVGVGVGVDVNVDVKACIVRPRMLLLV